MLELLTSAPIVLPRTARRRAEAIPQRPNLRLAWAVEPVTGKLAARWLVSGSEQVGTVGAALAV